MECEQCTWKDCTVSKGWDTLGSWLLSHISVWSPGWVSLLSLKIYVRTLNLQDRQCRCLWAKGLSILPWQTLLHCLHASTSDYYCCDVSVGLCRSAFQGLPLLKLWSSIPVFKNYPNLSQTKHLWTEPYQTVQNKIVTCSQIVPYDSTNPACELTCICQRIVYRGKKANKWSLVTIPALQFPLMALAAPYSA